MPFCIKSVLNSIIPFCVLFFHGDRWVWPGESNKINYEQKIIYASIVGVVVLVLSMHKCNKLYFSHLCIEWPYNI